VRVLSTTPARIGRIQGQGQQLTVGAPAELTLYDPSARRVFGRSNLIGKGVNSPYLEMTLPGQVLATFHRGYATVLDGVLQSTAQIDAARAALAAGRTGEGRNE